MEYIPLQNLNNQLLDDNDRIPPTMKSLDQKISNQKYKSQAKELLNNMDDLTQKKGVARVGLEGCTPAVDAAFLEWPLGRRHLCSYHQTSSRNCTVIGKGSRN